jgi:hypothetical protein
MREFTCPSGHTFEDDKFHSTVDLTKTDIDDAITFECPGGKRGHSFSLKRAVKSGMFNEEEGARICAQGQRQIEEFVDKITSAAKGEM